jgi:multidrug efflux pump subunit AcrA (membrane-fusion protein)
MMEQALLKRALIPILIIAVAVLVLIAMVKTRPQAPKMEKPPKVWVVNTITAQPATISPELTLYGRVETPREAALKSALEADVAEVFVLEGDSVSKGQKLIQLDDTDANLLLTQRKADVAAAQAQIDSEKLRFERDQSLLKQQQTLLELASKTVERARELDKTRLTPKSALDDAEAARERQLVTLKQLEHDIAEHPVRLAQLNASLMRAKALQQQAEVDLDRSLITAPFSGRIARLSVSVGDRVRNGDSLIALYDLQHLEVRAQIPGRYVRQVRSLLNTGNLPTAKAELDGQPIQFKLLRMAGEVKQDSGGVDGLFALQQHQNNLPLGSFIELQLQLAPIDGLIPIPFAALYGLDTVYKINKGLLQSVRIDKVGEQQGADGEKLLLIRSEQLQSGDQLVATQLPNAIDGLRVRAQ